MNKLSTENSPENSLLKKAKSIISKLTKDERIILNQRGYSLTDIREIQRSIKQTTYHLILPNVTDKPLTLSQVIDMMGREQWLEGLARSTFHTEAFRTGLNGERIRFYSRVWLP